MQKKTQRSVPKVFRPAFVPSKYYLVKSESSEPVSPLFVPGLKKFILISDLENRSGLEYREGFKTEGVKLPGAAVFWRLWTNPHLIPKVWKKYHVHFEGTVFGLRGDRGKLRFVIYLFWDSRKRTWGWDLIHTDCFMSQTDYSVVYYK